jgi:hypothetical protein
MSLMIKGRRLWLIIHDLINTLVVEYLRIDGYGVVFWKLDGDKNVFTTTMVVQSSKLKKFCKCGNDKRNFCYL